jgi:hypothetical protein
MRTVALRKRLRQCDAFDVLTVSWKMGKLLEPRNTQNTRKTIQPLQREAV